MKVNFKIGPVCLSVDTPADFPWTDEVSVFRIDEIPSGAEPFHYSLEFVRDFEPIWGTTLYRTPQMIVMDVEGQETRIHFLPGMQEPFAFSRRLNENHTKIQIDARAKNALKWDRNLLGLFSLEHDCLLRDGFLLHASYIISNDHAIIFTAPSGSGKSTQANLWAEYQRAEIINGDRTLLYRKDRRWYASGFPVCGSSPHCLNRTAPVRAIVFLEKAPENTAHQLNGFQALRKIYSQSIVNRWNPSDCQAVSDMIIDLAHHGKLFHYACTKEPDAVSCLKQIIFPSEEKAGI